MRLIESLQYYYVPNRNFLWLADLELGTGLTDSATLNALRHRGQHCNVPAFVFIRPALTLRSNTFGTISSPKFNVREVL